MSGRTPESLTRLEKAWLKRRYCAWCEAPTTLNTCFAMYGEKCTADMLNERRGRWLAESYRPRTRDSGRLPKGEDAGTAAECEASQSGGEAASPNPSSLSPNSSGHSHDL